MSPPLLDIHSTCDSEALSWPNVLVVTSGPLPESTVFFVREVFLCALYILKIFFVQSLMANRSCSLAQSFNLNFFFFPTTSDVLSRKEDVNSFLKEGHYHLHHLPTLELLFITHLFKLRGVLCFQGST